MVNCCGKANDCGSGGGGGDGSSDGNDGCDGGLSWRVNLNTVISSPNSKITCEQPPQHHLKESWDI
jgi:hypothetical protein